MSTTANSNQTKTMTITQKGLAQFTGKTEYHHLYKFPQYSLTDGVLYVFLDVGSWVINRILEYQCDSAIIKHLNHDYFQQWTLTVSDNNEAILTCEDGDGNTVKQWDIDFYTDFPLARIQFFLINNVLMLPSEY